MARSVYFGFHYQRDIFRMQQVKQQYITKGNYTAAGYFDGSLEEKAKSEGVEVVKRLIDKALVGSTVLCVLIGQETSTRHWVYYEIFKSIEASMGVFGIRIHKLKDPKTGADTSSINPFDHAGYGRREGKLVPMIKYTNWLARRAQLQPISTITTTYFANVDKPMLNSLFRVYDWVDDDGYANFNQWCEAAAKQAGR